jgi:hypothetical protein
MTFLKCATLASLVAIAIMVWRSRVRVIPVDLAGASFPEVIASGLDRSGLPRLSDKDRFPFIYRQAVVLVADAISKEGLQPSEYFVELRSEDVGRSLRFSLWHESRVGSKTDPNIKGDPSGKGRTVEFDSIRGVVTAVRGWR